MSKKAVVGISMVPVGTGSPSVSSEVAFFIKKLQEKGLQVVPGPAFSSVEGDLFEVVNKVLEATEETLNVAPRIVLTLKIDVRGDKELSIKSKMDSLSHKLHTET